jgi:cyclopropane-fatty-acyl-phospholipid synthase
VIADRLERALRPILRGDLPVRLKAWDGSVAGPVDAPLVVLGSVDAVRRMLRHPGELGAAQAYVTGELDVPGDLDHALTHAFGVARERGLDGGRPTMPALLGAVRTLRGIGALGRPPAAPASQAKVRGRLHSRRRDRSAISFHYDLSNEFYELVLDPQMAYSCGYHSSPDQPVEQAQLDKLSLVCRKLGLRPGMTLLDVGCGWGSLSLHAAERFGARVTGITISAEQKRYADRRIHQRGLGDLVSIELCDYRDAVPPPGGEYDAVASIEMGEHVGKDNYPTYASVLHRSVRPGGRVLVQQMSRGEQPGGGPFIESFIAPDMYMRPLGRTVELFEEAGLELLDVQALRRHYVLTVAGWLESFHRNRDRLVELVGEEVVRVWELYLVGGSIAFRDGRMGVDQLLMARPGAGLPLPLVRDW